MSEPVDPERSGGEERPAAGGPLPPVSGKARAAARRGVNTQWVNLLLLVPLIGVLVPQFYNSDSPRWGGIPFFYWYQLVWIPLSVCFTYFVYRATRGER
jgi:Protein of unknown function (DUF3311)